MENLGIKGHVEGSAIFTAVEVGGPVVNPGNLDGLEASVQRGGRG